MVWFEQLADRGHGQAIENRISAAVCHVTSRGNRRMRIFRDDEEKLLFLEVLGWVHERFGWLCYAYRLMENHYHLVVEPVVESR